MGALALSLALVACGSGNGEESTAETPALTKAQFLKKGNAICAAGTAKINKRFEKYSSKHLTGGRKVSERSYARAMAGIVLPLVTEEVEQIRKLGFPEGDDRRVAEILRAFEEGIRMGREDPLTMPGVHGRYAFEEAHELAIGYGLEKCALA